MVPVPLSGLQPSREEAIEEWPWLDEAVLRSSRSRQVCMTCHVFRHHPGPNCIPQLTCHLHQGLIAHGDHLIHRCSGWTEVTSGELLPDQPVPLLKRRWELSREEALRLWSEKRREGWQVCEPQWALAEGKRP